MPTAAPHFALVAGEASGDLLAGLLLQGLRSRWPTLAAAGIGGPQMLQQGFKAWWPNSKLAISGYAQVLRHYREISGIRKQLKTRLLAAPPGRLVFAGHSLGAAVATLAASMFQGSQPTLVTFGSPRVGDADFVAGLARVTPLRHVECCDIVTRVPPEIFDREHIHDLLRGFLGDQLAYPRDFKSHAFNSIGQDIESFAAHFLNG